MKNNKTSTKELLIYYSISFVITWLCLIFWVENEEFALEFRKKETTTAEVTNIEYDMIVQEQYDGRKANAYDVSHISYSYVVDGEKYEYGSTEYVNKSKYSISDKIEIEFVKNNPSISKIKGLNDYAYNFFFKEINSGHCHFICPNASNLGWSGKYTNS